MPPKDPNNAIISGVFAGYAKHFGMTAWSFRLLVLLIFIVTSPAHFGIGIIPLVILYIIFAYSMPKGN